VQVYWYIYKNEFYKLSSIFLRKYIWLKKKLRIILRLAKFHENFSLYINREFLQYRLPDTVKSRYREMKLITFSRQSRWMSAQWFFITIGFYT